MSHMEPKVTAGVHFRRIRKIACTGILLYGGAFVSYSSWVRWEGGHGFEGLEMPLRRDIRSHLDATEEKPGAVVSYKGMRRTRGGGAGDRCAERLALFLTEGPPADGNSYFGQRVVKGQLLKGGWRVAAIERSTLLGDRVFLRSEEDPSFHRIVATQDKPEHPGVLFRLTDVYAEPGHQPSAWHLMYHRIVNKYTLMDSSTLLVSQEAQPVVEKMGVMDWVTSHFKTW
eukprot:Rhum_TRINITY_DN8745_c0_g1::Rhum_TRINITY_DN8745_c0_g1_i1::g.29690::m.29690